MSQFEMVYHTRNFNSKLYQNFMMLAIDRKLRLFNEKPDDHTDSDFIDELLKLQVTQYSKNIIAVEAPKLKGHHDDRSDALMRSIWLASEALRTGVTHTNITGPGNLGRPVASSHQYQARKARWHNISDNRRNTRSQRGPSDFLKKFRG